MDLVGIRTAFLHRRLEAAVALRLALPAASPAPVSTVTGEGLFFVIGHGRSGTQWLAHLLNHAANAEVRHEPHKPDVVAAPRARIDRAFAERYARHLRLPYLRAQARPERLYGEVNSRLRHFLRFLQDELPNARYLRIFRDGRDVVRSSVARRDLHYARWLVRRHRAALADDPFGEEVLDFDDFAFACWLWRRDCLTQARAIPAWLDFERMVSSAAYVHREIVAPLGLDLPEAAIAERLRARLNSTRSHVLADWRSWTPGESETFWRICGEPMRLHGLAPN
jgi:hypothetical protein